MSESQQYPYSTFLDIKFPALALIDYRKASFIERVLPIAQSSSWWKPPQ